MPRHSLSCMFIIATVIHRITWLWLINLKYIYSVFTGNCGKLTYYISGSITHTFLKCLYLDYHSWTIAFSQLRLLQSYQDLAGWVHTSYCRKSQGMVDVEIWRMGHKPFHREAIVSKKSRSISPVLLVLVRLFSCAKGKSSKLPCRSIEHRGKISC